MAHQNTYTHWNSLDVETLRTNGTNLLLTQLVELLPNKTPSSISNKLQRMGIKKTKSVLSLKGHKARSAVTPINLHKLKTFNLDETQEAIFLGTLLGDGCISRHKKCLQGWDHYFSVSHGLKQKDYLLWKATTLSSLMPNIGGLDKKPTLRTPTHPFFWELRQTIYVDGKKRIVPDYIIKKLGILSLLIWYLDDGSYCKNKPIIRNCMLSLENLTKITRHINQKYNLEIYAKPTYIFFPKISRDKLFPIWRQLAKMMEIPTCMNYKLYS